VLTTQHPLYAKVGTNVADKRRSFGWYSSLTDSGYGVCFVFLVNSNKNFQSLSLTKLEEGIEKIKNDIHGHE
jgi:hypothetical protein